MLNFTVSSSAESLATPVRDRSVWIDHLRLFVILLVVNMHACVTYSHLGSWYVMSAAEPSFLVKAPFILWQRLLQSFFMGLLFFVAGYFAQVSIQHRGVANFARARIFRLGLPTLFYMAVIHPFILLVLNPWGTEFGSWAVFFARYFGSGHWLRESGPMWFTFALLVFSLIFAALRAWRPVDVRSSEPASAPSGRQVLIFALGLGAGSFLVRLWQPEGASILNMQLCYFTQYVAAFAIGITAGRKEWLDVFVRSSTARRAGLIGVVGGPFVLTVLILLVLTGVIRDTAPFSGGWHWQAAVLAFWEQLTGVGLGLGLSALFRARFDRQTPFIRWLSDRSFGVYLLHPPVLVALMMAFRGLPQNPYGLTALLTVTGLVASFLLSDLAHRIPGFRLIL